MFRILFPIFRFSQISQKQLHNLILLDGMEFYRNTDMWRRTAYISASRLASRVTLFFFHVF